MRVQVTGNTVDTLGGGVQVGGQGMYSAFPLSNTITITNNTFYNIQQGPVSVFDASNVGLPVGWGCTYASETLGGHSTHRLSVSMSMSCHELRSQGPGPLQQQTACVQTLAAWSCM